MIADDKRNPPLPPLDEKDHELAKLRWIIDELFEHLIHLHYAIESRGMDTAGVIDYLERKVYPPINEAAEKGKFYHDYTQYKPERWLHIQEGLLDEHAGDCMYEPFTCMRCYAEGFYGLDTVPQVPGSKTWKGKKDDPS